MWPDYIQNTCTLTIIHDIIMMAILRRTVNILGIMIVIRGSTGDTPAVLSIVPADIIQDYLVMIINNFTSTLLT